MGRGFCRTFELRFEAESESFIFDNVLVQLVLDKIIENAFRFSKKKVILKVIEISGVLRFLVVDDGEGFTSEGKKKAKSIFYSTDKSRGHLGIGLYLAELLLEQHKSTLNIGNADQGAEIYFDIECENFVKYTH